jgi:hypothetical protein
MSSPAGAYKWLQGRSQMGGSPLALVDPSQSCLTWYSGNMPPRGPSSNAQAVTDMNAWAAAGAKND